MSGSPEADIRGALRAAIVAALALFAIAFAAGVATHVTP